MAITDVSILHHVAIVLVLLWVLAALNWCNPISYMLSLVYLYLVHERYTVRLRKKIQFEERKQANQKRVLSESETVRWLNHAMEKIWPICMEQIVSQQVLLPIIPWFLEKYKPWTAKEAMVQHMYMGRNAPMFTDMRVLRQNTGDDHLVMELGMNFLSADDMSAVLAVKLRRRLGFGMWAKLHITGMHVEGRVLVGVKFLPKWPFLGRLRVCFIQPPYFQMTVKPVFTHGLDVTELPGIAGWLDKLLSIAFEETLVEPNMLVVDMEKFVSVQPETWFSVDEKDPVAHAKVEVIEASDLKPADLNGLSDPYVKGQLGPYRFRTKTQKKTLAPKWHEEFIIPICTWDSPNILAIDVGDKDFIVDDALGECTINISDFRDNQRHDMWVPLQNVKMGRLHLAITVTENIGKGGDHPPDEETINKVENKDSFASETAHKGSFSFSSTASEKSQKVADDFEPINIEGQEQTGIWVHHPGSEVPQTWEPRKGKGRRLDTKVRDSFGRHVPESSVPISNGSSSTDENGDGTKKPNRVRRGLNKIGSMFNRSPKKNDFSGNVDALLSPRANVKAGGKTEIGAHLIVEDTFLKVSGLSPEESGLDSPRNGNAKEVAKSILNKTGKSFKQVIPRQGSRRHDSDSDLSLRNTRYDSDDDVSLSSPRHPPTVDPIPGVTLDPTITIINSADK